MKVEPDCHQAAVVDVALGDDAVERRHDALVGLLLLEYANLGFLGRNIRLSHSHRGLAAPAASGDRCRPAEA